MEGAGSGGRRAPSGRWRRALFGGGRVCTQGPHHLSQRIKTRARYCGLGDASVRGCLQEQTGAEDGRSGRRGAKGLGGHRLIVRAKAKTGKCSQFRDVPPPKHGAPGSRGRGVPAGRSGLARSLAGAPTPASHAHTRGTPHPRCRPGTPRTHDALSRPTGEDLTPKGRSQNSKHTRETPSSLKHPCVPAWHFPQEACGGSVCSAFPACNCSSCFNVYHLCY